MIKPVPSRTGLQWYALVGVSSLLAGAGLGFGSLVLKWAMGGLAVMSLADLWFSRGRPAQVRVGLPELVRLSRNREGRFFLELTNAGRGLSPVLIGIPFDGSAFQAEAARQVGVGTGKSRLEWRLTGTGRGRYRIRTCYLRLPSVLGLWSLDTRKDADCELRIYPDMLREQKALAARFFTAGTGAHSRQWAGKGREFERLREYLPGDLYEDIHWKATARRGSPVTKIFQTEQTQDIYLVIDASRTSAGPADKGQTFLDQYVLTALSAGRAAQKQGDRFGMVVFSDQVSAFVPAGRGRAHYNHCRDALFTLTPSRATPDYFELITFICNRVRKRALLIFLTSLDDPAAAEGLVDHVHLLSRRHLVMVNTLGTAGMGPVFSTGPVGGKEEIVENLSRHMVWQFSNELRQSLGRKGAAFFMSDPAGLSFQVICRYLEIKQRQQL